MWKRQVADAQQVGQVLRERRLMWALHHPFIVRLCGTAQVRAKPAASPFAAAPHRFSQDKASLYLLQEYLHGGELFQVVYSEEPAFEQLRERKYEDDEGDYWEGLKPEVARFYAANVAEVLRYLHKVRKPPSLLSPSLDSPPRACLLVFLNLSLPSISPPSAGAPSQHKIAYRDLKLENLLIAGDGYLRLADFGFAKPIPYIAAYAPGRSPAALGNSQGEEVASYTPMSSPGDSCLLSPTRSRLFKHERTYTTLGSAAYMAPEVLSGKGHGLEADAWSFGVLLYELLTGTVPYGGGSDNPYDVSSPPLFAMPLLVPSRPGLARGVPSCLH